MKFVGFNRAIGLHPDFQSGLKIRMNRGAHKGLHYPCRHYAHKGLHYPQLLEK